MLASGTRWAYVGGMTTNLFDHPGYTYSAAGAGFRLYWHGRFAGWFASFAEVTAAAR